MTEYTLLRSARRTLTVEVKQSGDVVVHAPLHLSKKRIDEFVESKSAWIENKIDKCRKLMIPNIVASMTEAEKRETAEKARVILGEKLDEYAGLMGLKYSKMKITRAEHRFGSCTSKGVICFSYRLILYPDAAQDYVVIHELAHLVEMNHSRAFYAIVENYMPDYRAAEKLLKES